MRLTWILNICIYLKSIRYVCLDIQTDIQYYVEFLRCLRKLLLIFIIFVFFFSLTPIWKTLKIDLLQYNFHLLITQLWPNAKLQTIQVKRRNRICKIHPQLACHKQENMCSSNFISKRNRWESIGKKHGYCFVNHAQMDPLNESSIRI